MLTLLGDHVRHCDRLPRRSFLKAGALGIAGLTLADLLRAEQQAGIGSSQRAVINIHLDGGPPQMDLIDPKPDVPEEYRSAFSSIPTKLPGIHFTDLLPKLASIADKMVFIRSLVGAASKHDAFQCQSGFDDKSLSNLGGRPSMGSVISKLMGTPTDAAPVFVDLMQGRPFARNSARAGFLGPAHGPFRPDISHLFHRELEDAMKVELAKLGSSHSTSLALSPGLTVGRLQDRLSLLQGLDRTRRMIDRAGDMSAMDRFTQQAYGILTSEDFANALDLENEDPNMLARYTPSLRDEGKRFYTSEGPTAGRKLLLARRLVEAGVRCVSVSISDFDTHSDNNPRMKQLGPLIDHALHALITDLAERGMLDDVTIVAWGEFGRTPKINAKGGRDHWPRVAMAMMAGGGLKVGQVIGSTDRYAGEVTAEPVHYQDVIATLYHQLGIDPNATTIQDPSGRPQFLVDQGHPIEAII